MKDYFIYMIECVNGSYYTGYTIDIKRRYNKHCEGSASKYTRAFKPKKLVACWCIASTSSSAAMKLEAFIKKLSPAKKKALATAPHSLNKIIDVALSFDIVDLSVSDIFL